MDVKVYPYRVDAASVYGNVLWPGKFPMRGGVFPPNHPCAPMTKWYGGRRGQCGTGPALDAFRARGYWASCFPEGDGITWQPERGQSDQQCLADIRECFGWEASWAKGVTIKAGA